MGGKFDSIKMAELLKVEDPDAEGGLTLHFKGDVTLKIRAREGGGLESVIS